MRYFTKLLYSSRGTISVNQVGLHNDETGGRSALLFSRRIAKAALNWNTERKDTSPRRYVRLRRDGRCYCTQLG